MAEREEKIGGMDELWLMLLLLTANGSPIVARELLGNRLDYPLDGGRSLADGQRILGDSKTWRGLVAAVLASTLLTLAIGWPWQVGVVIGLAAMLGDSASSLIKRRLGLPSSSPAPGLDHIPESLLPLLACKSLLQLSWTQVILLSLGFMLANLLLSRLLHRLGIRRHPS
jgi:CDP-2,3-bis-(O-geranylgeranyl)-sn-glycerol synthase